MGVVLRSDASRQDGYVIAGLSNRKDSEPATSSDDVKDPLLLAQILTQIRRDLGAVRIDARGRWIEYEDLSLAGSGAVVNLPHGLGGRVRFWPTDVEDDGSGTQPKLSRDPINTTDDVLVLKSYQALTTGVTIRIEKVTA